MSGIIDKNGILRILRYYGLMNKYARPNQGTREIARRKRQIERGMIDSGQLAKLEGNRVVPV